MTEYDHLADRFSSRLEQEYDRATCVEDNVPIDMSDSVGESLKELRDILRNHKSIIRLPKRSV